MNRDEWLFGLVPVVLLTGCNPDHGGRGLPGGGGNIGGAAAAVLMPLGDDPHATGLFAPWVWTQTMVGRHLGADGSIPGDADIGKSVFAAYEGEVVIAGDYGGWGGVVALRCVARPNQPFLLPGGATAKVVYVLIGHVAPTVKVGDRVTAGQPIAAVEPLLPGVASSGPHAHVEVIKGDSVDSGAVSLPGPGYADDPVVVDSRVDPVEFFRINRRPLEQEARTLKAFSSPVRSVVIVNDDTAFVSDAGVNGGALGGLWRLNYVTGDANKVADFFLPGHVAYDPARDEVLLAVAGEGRLVAVELSNNHAIRNLETGLNQPASIAIDSSQSRYVYTTNDHEVRALPFAGGPSMRIAGTGTGGSSGDGGDPLQADLVLPTDVAVANGVVYFCDGGQRVRYIQGGVIRTLLTDVSPTGLEFGGNDLWLTSGHQVLQDIDGTLYSRVGHAQEAGTRDGVLHQVLMDAPRDLSIRNGVTLIATDDRVLIIR